MAPLQDTTHILFDLDGTLTNSKPGILRCVQYALEQCGTPEPDERRLYPFIGPPLYESFQRYCGMTPEQATFAVAQYRVRFAKVGMFENAVYPGVPALLQKLKDAGFILAIATSKPELFTRQILDHFDLTPYFAAIAGSDITKEGETKADIIRLSLSRLGLPTEHPPHTVMIGDRQHDIIGAHACGIPCVGVEYGYAPEGELLAFGAEYIVPDLAALGTLFGVA